MKPFIYLRSFLAIFAFLILTLIDSLLVIVNSLFQSRYWHERIVRMWARLSLAVWSVHVEVQGLENVPAGGCIFVFNHSSHFDIPVIYSVGLSRCFFGAKIELFSIPIFGRAMRVGGTLPIVRADRAQVFKLYEDSVKRLENGDRFLLAGEGTRQPNPGVGEKFKAGPFVFAIKGQCPIVPIVLHGSGELLPKGRIIPCTKSWRSRVTLRYLKPIATTGMTLESREQLQAQTREIMLKAYQELEHSSHNA